MEKDCVYVRKVKHTKKRKRGNKAKADLRLIIFEKKIKVYDFSFLMNDSYNYLITYL